MLNARALHYAVFVSVIIALCSGLLIQLTFLHSWQLTENQNHQATLRKLQLGVVQVLYKDCGQLYCQWGEQLLDDNSSFVLRKEQWGFYDLGIATTLTQKHNGWDTLSKSFIIGKSALEDFPTALYLSDQNRPLLLAGNSKLIGNAFLPKAGIRRGNIEGKPFLNPRLVEGNKGISSPFLPELNQERLGYWQTHWNKGLLEGERIEDNINSFSKPTIYYNGGSINLKHADLSGNIIICAKQLITVDASSKLTDVILIAPNIIIKTGFKGTIQAVAWNQLLVEAQTNLSYPSALGLLKTNLSDSLSQIVIREKSKINGLVFLTQQEQNKNIPRIIIKPTAQIYGQIYANGWVQLEGKLYGNLSCNRLFVQTPSGVYDNTLLNGVIVRDRLPNYFLGAILTNKETKKGIVKWVN